jgi:uncharacterized damage-inducible protein DinB
LHPTRASEHFMLKVCGFCYVIYLALAWSAEFERSVLHVATVSRSGRIEGGEMKDLDGLRELTHHMQWADALVWAAALSNSEAADDLALRGKLFHTHMVQRAFLSVWQAGPLVPPPSDPPDLLTTLESALEYYSDLGAFFSVLGEDELERPVSLPWAGRFAQRLGRDPATPSLAETILQVAMHSTYHRGQVNARLRELGIEPPLTDYIAWVWFGRPEAQWLAPSP